MTAPARILLLDPPWAFRNRHEVRHDGGKSRFGIGVASRYSAGVMSRKEMAGLRLADVAAPDALMFCWTTWTHLRECIWLIRRWGWEYQTLAMIWVKVYPKSRRFFRGPGRYVPANTEPLLLATRPGSRLWHPNTGWKPGQVVVAPHPRYPERHENAGKIIHSRKPEVFQDRMERWLGPHLDGYSMLEVFATRPRDGWLTLGHAVSGRDIRDELADMRRNCLTFGAGPAPRRRSATPRPTIDGGQLSLLDAAQ